MTMQSGNGTGRAERASESQQEDPRPFLRKIDCATEPRSPEPAPRGRGRGVRNSEAGGTRGRPTRLAG